MLEQSTLRIMVVPAVQGFWSNPLAGKGELQVTVDLSFLLAAWEELVVTLEMFRQPIAESLRPPVKICRVLMHRVLVVVVVPYQHRFHL
jgi:hypothetical protein